jgi:hypothetical protein
MQGQRPRRMPLPGFEDPITPSGYVPYASLYGLSLERGSLLG